MGKKKMIAVIGASQPPADLLKVAEEAGRLIAENGAVLVCGGLGGVMEAAARGAKSGQGLTIGILPSHDKTSANPYIDIVIPTGLSEARNVIVASAADVVISIGGGYGTLSEIAFALQHYIPVIGINTWEAKQKDLTAKIIRVSSAKEAITRAMEL
ncbi:MAG: TIGR00725 family protein [Candidatus Omnitrophota bacterium]